MRVAGDGGGAIAVRYHPVTVWNSTFVGNSVTGTGGDGGGAVTVFDSTIVRVETDTGPRLVRFAKAIVATGSYSVSIPGFAIDGKDILGSKEALDLTAPPKALVVIGGGATGGLGVEGIR